jgi:hypothetical protein
VHAIGTWKLDTRTELVCEGLTSEAAQQFLQELPSSAELLPTISVDDLQAELSAKWERNPRLRLGWTGERRVRS